MSYILEALKESQRSRDARPVPDLGTVHIAPEPEQEADSPRSRLLPGLFLVLMILGAVGGWWFAGGSGDEAPTQPVAMVDAPSAAVVIADTEDPNTAIAPSQDTVVPVVKPPVSEAEPVPSPPVDNALASAAIAKTAVEPEPLPRSLPQPKEETEKKLPVTQVAEPAVVAERPEVIPSVQPEPLAVGVAAAAIVVNGGIAGEAAASVSPPVEQERIPHYRELPFDIQQELEGVSYSVHLYSPNPERRLVKINGIVRREGAEVSPGLVLSEVTQDGAIFTYRDYRFRIPVR